MRFSGKGTRFDMSMRMRPVGRRMSEIVAAIGIAIPLLSLTTAQAQQQAQQAQQKQQQAQQQQQGQQQQEPFTIKIDTQLVVQTVLVKDKDGKTIEGLTE